MPSFAHIPSINSHTNSHSIFKVPPIWYGILLSVSLGFIAWQLGNYVPLIGGAVLGILIGLLWRNIIGVSPVFTTGIKFCTRQILQWSIIFLGFGLSLNQVLSTGLSSLAVTLITLSAAFVSAYYIGKWLNLSAHISTMIGVGTAICGGSAIAAVAPIIQPKDNDLAMSISVIFLFNIIAVLIFPPLGHLMGLSDAGFGLWAGTAINDTSSVVAAGYSYSMAAGDIATIVKLTRATLIIPVCLTLVFIMARKSKANNQSLAFRKIFPWFILWFVVASTASSIGLVPSGALPYLNDIAHFLIVVALTAVGLSSDLRQLIKAGVKPLLLGLGVWFAVLSTSLIAQYALDIL